MTIIIAVKEVSLTVAEFKILIAVSNQEMFQFVQVYDFVNDNSGKENNPPDELMPVLELSYEALNDMIDSISGYRDSLNKHDPNLKSVNDLLEKLEAIQ